MAEKSSAGKSEVVVEEGVSPEGTPTRTIRIVGDMTKQNREQLARVLALPLAAVHPAMKASAAANKPAVAPNAATVPVVLPNAPAAVASAPVAPEKKSMFQRGMNAMIGMPSRETKPNILNRVAVGAMTPFTWTATKAVNTVKRAGGWVIGNGSVYNPVTWTGKTVRTMLENKKGAGAGMLAGFLAGGSVFPPLSLPLLVSIMGVGAAGAFLQRFNNETETPAKAS